ncbi:FR47-like protein domain-containing protein [Phthorimaea operculella]|nr:FR47-like protein domain-containing protein [Phthorimaea operculella]
MAQDSFHVISVKEWEDLKNEFKANWPRGITGYYALDTFEKWLELGVKWDENALQILNPFGNPKNGMVAILKNEEEYIECLIECPHEDTSRLADALTSTNLIDWTNKDVSIVFPQKHIMDCLRRIVGDIDVNIEWECTLQLYVLPKETQLFDVSIPQGFSFKDLTKEYLELYDSTWPHQFPGSIKYFQLQIQAKSGFGLFKDDQIVAFGFVKEMGALGHVYTLKEHRRKGYGAMITKFICNERLKQGKDVLSFCMDGNVASSKMHQKLGFSFYFDVSAAILKRSSKPLAKCNSLISITK